MQAPFVSALDLPKSSQPYPNVIGSAGRVHVCGIAVLEGDFMFRVSCVLGQINIVSCVRT